MSTAFRLTPAYTAPGAPEFLGGVIRAGDREVNLGDELDAGDGFIVVEDTDVAAVNALDEHEALERVPEDVNVPTPVSPTIRPVGITADERLELERAIADNGIVNDEDLAEWVAGATVTDLLGDVDDDVLLAKRVYLAEQARGDAARSSLLTRLYKIIHPEA